MGEGGEPGRVADHRDDGLHRVVRQVHRLEQLEVARHEGEWVLQLTRDGVDQRAAVVVQLAQLGRRGTLTLDGTRIEDGPARVVGDVEGGRALVVGPPRPIGVTIDREQTQQVGAGADRHHHDLAQAARGDVRRQLAAEVLVKVLVAPDAVVLDDQHGPVGPTPAAATTSGPRARPA
ncbi:hypothetical protein [Nocardioides sp. B-3]|uniref:hypothetical protein n=1 Tax=Nocardioides sp. B-3 TaxID=2895565 RepID=UPI002153053A|nr:hypothetical protein [Nocardioides sp. B-3]UUZ60944.1 hypothetical protein LP418_09735 [Nocardioides sp. B-3]